MRRTATFRIPRAAAVAVGQDRVWVLAEPRSSSPTLFYPIRGTAKVWEIEPAHNRVVAAPVRLDALQPLALAVGGRAVWIVDYSRTLIRLDIGR